MFFDDGSIESLTRLKPNPAYNVFYREIAFDPLEEFSGFGGVGIKDINYGCDTDSLYLFAYKKCPLVPILPPDLSFISSDLVQMTVLFSPNILIIDFGAA